MEFRLAKVKDIDQIMSIIKKAQVYLKSENIPQWQNNYPKSETIKKDIENKYSYVLVMDNKIYATAAVSFDGEETYNNIYEGKWLTNDNYAVIHRMAVDMDYRGKGISNEFLKAIENHCINKVIFSIKIDTHRKNIAMKKFLKKNAYEYCGIIYLKDGNERFAYEKILDR